tara:strand:+ start:1250 stop:2734 length:1485 start_codon:yes stop_codon:yes gene_type:complete
MQEGITSVIDSKPDYELEPIGIASFQDQAEKLANMGRNGDTYIVHAAEGETVLPMEVLDANPQLKNMLFTQMRDMGIEPERYIVGNQLNSINPITGQPEFFLKKIFKGLKNVGKALKKNASIVLPFVLGQFGIGTTASGLLGAGLGSLIQGDDPKEALRKAAIGGLSGAALAGLRNVGRGGGTFTGGVLADLEQGYQGLRPKNIGETLSNPFKRAQQALSNFASGFAKKQPSSIDNVVTNTQTQNLANVETGNLFKEGGMSYPGDLTAFEVDQAANLMDLESLKDIEYSSIPFTQGYSLKGPSVDDIIKSREFAELRLAGFTPDKALAALQKEYTGPSFLQKYGIPLAGITGAAALGGFFSAPEEEPEEEILTGQDLIDEDPDKYYIDVAAQPFVDKTQVDSVYGIPSLPQMSPYPIPTMPVFAAKKGGAAFPRRTGGIGPGLGSGKKDDVPAMLMDGEFVMTRKAVKNAGNGSLNKGIKNMYSLMRNLEARRA